jgi:hypothetical protein
MSKLEMSFVGRLVILIDNIDVEQRDETEARLSIGSITAESGLRRDPPTPSALS